MRSLAATLQVKPLYRKFLRSIGHKEAQKDTKTIPLRHPERSEGSKGNEVRHDDGLDSSLRSE